MTRVRVRRLRAQQLAVGREVLELVTYNAAQPSLQCLALAELGFNGRTHLRLRTLVEGHYNRVLRVEVVVRRADGHLGLGGNLPHGRVGEAALAKNSQRG